MENNGDNKTDSTQNEISDLFEQTLSFQREMYLSLVEKTQEKIRDLIRNMNGKTIMFVTRSAITFFKVDDYKTKDETEFDRFRCVINGVGLEINRFSDSKEFFAKDITSYYFCLTEIIECVELNDKEIPFITEYVNLYEKTRESLKKNHEKLLKRMLLE